MATETRHRPNWAKLRAMVKQLRLEHRQLMGMVKHRATQIEQLTKERDDLDRRLRRFLDVMIESDHTAPGRKYVTLLVDERLQARFRMTEEEIYTEAMQRLVKVLRH